jgi:hypothetical protein
LNSSLELFQIIYQSGTHYTDDYEYGLVAEDFKVKQIKDVER